MKLYKITDKQDRTRNQTQWGEGVERSVLKRSFEKHADWNFLCSKDFIHSYLSLGQMVLFFKNHGLPNLEDLNVWEAEGEPQKYNWDKVGSKKLKTLKKIDFPKINTIRAGRIYEEWLFKSKIESSAYCFNNSIEYIKEDLQKRYLTLPINETIKLFAKDLDKVVLKKKIL